MPARGRRAVPPASGGRGSCGRGGSDVRGGARFGKAACPVAEQRGRAAGCRFRGGRGLYRTEAAQRDTPRMSLYAARAVHTRRNRMRVYGAMLRVGRKQHTRAAQRLACWTSGGEGRRTEYQDGCVVRRPCKRPAVHCRKKKDTTGHEGVKEIRKKKETAQETARDCFPPAPGSILLRRQRPQDADAGRGRAWRGSAACGGFGRILAD